MLLICMTITQVNILRILLLHGTEEVVIYTAQYIAPVIVQGIFLNMMAIYGGAL